jgi:hypothetical protein
MPNLSKSKTNTQKMSPIEIRKIPSILTVERKLFFTALPDQLEAELEELVDKTSFDVFGITEKQTKFNFPDDYEYLSSDSERRWQIDDEFEEHEADYLTAQEGELGSVEVLLRVGVDFRDENGFPLKCTRYLKRQAEIAAKGKMGKLPDITAINEANWEENTFSKFEKEAKAFQRKNRS